MINIDADFLGFRLEKDGGSTQSLNAILTEIRVQIQQFALIISIKSTLLSTLKLKYDNLFGMQYHFQLMMTSRQTYR